MMMTLEISCQKPALLHSFSPLLWEEKKQKDWPATRYPQQHRSKHEEGKQEEKEAEKLLCS